MVETRHRGTAAAPGVADGPALIESGFTADAVAEVAAPADDPEAEAAALRQAVADAGVALGDLVAGADEETASILAFQVALLEDEALLDPAYEAIALGQSAALAVTEVLQAQIDHFAADEDEYFRARAADLADVRDRLLRALQGRQGDSWRIDGWILVAPDLTPSHFLDLHHRGLAAVVLQRGSRTSHVALLARARAVPMLVGMGDGLAAIRAGERLLVDGDGGELACSPSPETERVWARHLQERAVAGEADRAWRRRQALTALGERVEVELNLDDPDLLGRLDPAECDGVGLVRTEFLYHGAAPPDEEAQLGVYRRLIAWAGGRPLTIRTLDAGGDKPIAGVTAEGERNPFLGLRGVRLSLARPALFRVQLRALARAAAIGPIRVMLPMVTVPAEVKATQALLAEEVRALLAAGIPAELPPLGMMVEVPAAALAAERFPVVFYSIGSNDLVQYTMAAARDEPLVAALYDPLAPAVLALIQRLVIQAGRLGRPVTLCGDMASDPACIPTLLRLGVGSLSVTPTALGRVKRTIAAYDERLGGEIDGPLAPARLGP